MATLSLRNRSWRLTTHTDKRTWCHRNSCRWKSRRTVSGIAVLVGNSLTRLVRDKMLKVLGGRKPRALAPSAAGIRHGSVLNIKQVVVEVAMIRAVGQAGPFADDGRPACTLAARETVGALFPFLGTISAVPRRLRGHTVPSWWEN